MNILSRIKLWVKIKHLFYRYNLKRKEEKSTQQILTWNGKYISSLTPRRTNNNEE